MAKNITRPFIITVVLIVILAIGIFIFVKIREKATNIYASPIYKDILFDSKSEYSVFSHSKYGFTFKYPKEIISQSSSEPDIINFKYTNNPVIAGPIQVEIELLGINETAKDRAIRKYAGWFNTKNVSVGLHNVFPWEHDADYYDTKVISTEVFSFINPKGIEGDEIYFTEETTWGRKVSQKIRGPFFAIELALKDQKYAFMAHGFIEPRGDENYLLNTLVSTLELQN